MTLYIVATPIGNLEDMTLRAIRVLKEVDGVLAEDTRQTKKLLSHYDIETPVRTVHQHTATAQLEKLVSELESGKDLALVSDAGTPNVSDPGGKLVDLARTAGTEVVPIPGASALTTLLSVAGIATDSFLFLGFLPKKKGRQTLWKELANLDLPIVLFESPHRIAKTLEETSTFLGDRHVTIGRELTKIHEEIITNKATVLHKHYVATPPKGEIVVIIHPQRES